MISCSPLIDQLLFVVSVLVVLSIYTHYKEINSRKTSELSSVRYPHHMPRPNRKRRTHSDRRRDKKKKSGTSPQNNPPRKKRRRKRTKAQIQAAKVRRKLREEAAPGRGVTKDDRKRVFQYYGRKCLRCGTTRRLVLDHVRALYCGGRHDPDNLQPLCFNCNTKKGLKTIDYRPFPFYY